MTVINLDEAERRSGVPPRVPPQTVTAKALQDRRFAPIRYVVPGYIAEGCTLLAGAPKVGKSWFVLDVAKARAEGGTCLGNIVLREAEDVLYLALEDNLRRLQSRMDKIGLMGAPWPERLTFATEWARAHEGGLDDIRTWAKAREKPRLVIIDVLTAFRRPIGGKENAYQADYEAIKGMQTLASDLNLAIVVVHHTRKSRDQVDPFDRVSGTLGLSGAADSTLILDRDGQGVTLYGRGRDIAEVETAMTFDRDSCRWRIVGQAAEVRRSDERAAVLEILSTADEPMSAVTLAQELGMSQAAARQLLRRMLKANEVLKARRGRYVHPERSDLMEPP